VGVAHNGAGTLNRSSKKSYEMSLLKGLISVAHMCTRSFAICDFTDDGTAAVDAFL